MQKRKGINIAVFLPQIYSEYTVLLRQGIEEEADKRHFNLEYYTCFSDNSSSTYYGGENRYYDEGERTIFRLIDFDRFDAVLMLYDCFDKVQWNEIYDIVDNRCHCPIINFRTPLCGVHNIYVDDDTSFRDMVNHFVKVHHCKHINLVTGPKDNVHSDMRLDIYRRALESNGIEYDPKRVYYGNFWRDCGDAVVDHFIEWDDTMPEAIVCANDYMAISVIEALEKRGYRVPEEIMVSGYDNVEESYYNRPSLTTVKQPVVNMGHKGIEMADMLIQGEEVPDEIYMPAEMVIRQSCGCEKRTIEQNTSYASVLTGRLDKMAYLETTTTAMVTLMSGAGDLQECLRFVQEYAMLDTGFQDFALCLAQNWESQLPVPETSYGQSDESIYVAIEIHDGIQAEPNYISVSQLLPNSFLQDDKPYYIVPLHYMQYYLGYAVVSIAYNVPNWNSIKAWFLHLESAMENTRIRAQLHQVVQELEELYDKDTLTGLYNRRGFDKFGKEFYEECRTKKYKLFVMVIDMDGLKQVNDAFGHSNGDICITLIANAMSAAAQNGEICIRSGGDEYIVVAKDYSEDKIRAFQTIFYSFISHANDSLDRPYQFGASCGYYMDVPDETLTLEEFLKRADYWMYKNKKQRKATSHPGIDIR